MAREYLFVVLCLIVVGPLALAGALVAWLRGTASSHDSRAPAGELEAHATRQLLLPLVPAALGVALLLGWLVVEPPQAERLPWQAFVLAVPAAVVLLRALLRAIAACVARHNAPAATIGFFRQRVWLDPKFVEALNEDEHAAVMAHEVAHATHHDPLRLLVAQIVTDLQWPMPGAPVRLRRFQQALELARDEEARERVEGAALASAVLRAARLAVSQRFASAAIVTPEALLRARVERLLSPLPPQARRAVTPRFGLAVLGTALLSSFFAGVFFGESALRAVLGCTP